MTTATAIVTRTNIIGTRHQVFTAWVPTDMTTHSTLRHFGDQCYGRVGTERLPAEIDAMPARSEARSEAYRAWRDQTYREAYTLIREAFLDPEGIDGGSLDMGEVRWESDQTGSEERPIF